MFLSVVDKPTQFNLVILNRAFGIVATLVLGVQETRVVGRKGVTEKMTNYCSPIS